MRILRGLSSRFYPCGCLAGIYETYGGEVVAIVDVRGSLCPDPAHRAGHVLPEPARDQPLTPPSRQHG